MIQELLCADALSPESSALILYSLVKVLKSVPFFNILADCVINVDRSGSLLCCHCEEVLADFEPLTAISYYS